MIFIFLFLHVRKSKDIFLFCLVGIGEDELLFVWWVRELRIVLWVYVFLFQLYIKGYQICARFKLDYCKFLSYDMVSV